LIAGMIQNRIGVSMVEIMVAFTILVMSVLSISGLVSYGHRGTEKDFRNVQAIQILEEQMNKMLAASYSKIESTMGAAAKTTLNNVLFAGTEHQIVLGKLTVSKTEYDITAELEKVPVSFGIMPLEIDNSYEFAKVETYRFGALTNTLARFDGSNNNKNRYRVIKVIMRVRWVEPIVNKNREVAAMSYIVDHPI